MSQPVASDPARAVARSLTHISSESIRVLSGEKDRRSRACDATGFTALVTSSASGNQTARCLTEVVPQRLKRDPPDGPMRPPPEGRACGRHAGRLKDEIATDGRLLFR